MILLARTPVKSGRLHALFRYLLRRVFVVINPRQKSSDDERIDKWITRNVKNAYRAHNVARKEYLRSYREAYLESILANSTEERRKRGFLGVSKYAGSHRVRQIWHTSE